MSAHNIETGSILRGAGVAVVPCQEGGESAKAPYTPRGFKQASTNYVAGKIWAKEYPGAVWGVPCAPNNVLVLDADRHGKDDGVRNLMTIFEENGFDWRTVPVVATPNGGYHYYFNRPTGLERTRATLCGAVDIKNNGYVIAPDCQMLDGRWYKLVRGTLEEFAEAIAARSLPNPPAWLLPMLLHPPVPPPKEIAEPIDDEALLKQIKGIVAAVLKAQEGQRNRLLFWAACRFAELVKADIVTHELAAALLERAGTELGLSTREVRATVASGLRMAWEGDHNAR